MRFRLPRIDRPPLLLVLSMDRFVVDVEEMFRLRTSLDVCSIDRPEASSG